MKSSKETCEYCKNEIQDDGYEIGGNIYCDCLCFNTQVMKNLKASPMDKYHWVDTDILNSIHQSSYNCFEKPFAVVYSSNEYDYAVYGFDAMNDLAIHIEKELENRVCSCWKIHSVYDNEKQTHLDYSVKIIFNEEGN